MEHKQNNEQFGKQETEHSGKQVIMQELMENISYAMMVLGGAKRDLCESKVGETFKGQIPKAVKMYVLMKTIVGLSEANPKNPIDRDKLYKGITAVAVWALETMDFVTIFGRKGSIMASVLITKECPFCDMAYQKMFPAEGWRKYRAGGLVQDCFPEMSPDDREFLISGICPECWDKQFGEG